MNILGLIEKLLNRDNNKGISINSDFCVRLKTPMAGCYTCIDRCPDLSIKITDNDIKILENCSKCNACIHICPNSVFYVKNNILEEERCGSQASAGNIYYFCAKTENKKAVNKVECLLEIEDIDIISLMQKGNKIFFITEDCKSCKLNYFHNKKLKRVDEIKKFLKTENAFTEINIEDFRKRGQISNMTSFPPESIKINENKNGESGNDGKSNQKSETLDRRDFFKNSIKNIKNNAKKIIEDISIEDLPLSELYAQYIDTGDKGGKKINKLLIKRQKKIYLFLRENQSLLPLLNIRLPKLNENCVFCSSCWELCPTGALIYKEKEGEILIEPFLCTGCNLCRDICNFGAVRIYKVKKIQDVSDKKILIKKV